MKHSARHRLRTLYGDLLFLLVLPLTILLVGLLLALGGCSGSQIGPSFQTNPDGSIFSRNADVPNRVSLFKNGEAWNTESAVPGSFTRFFASDGTSIESIGPKSRIWELPWMDGRVAKVASDTDTTFHVDSITTADGTVIKGLTLSTLSSPAITAQTSALAAFASVIQSRDAASAETLLADAAAVQAIVAALGPPALELLRAISLGL